MKKFDFQELVDQNLSGLVWDEAKRRALREQANEEVAKMLKTEALATLDKVLFELSNQMKNAYSRSDA